jgi:hypothetical protein
MNHEDINRRALRATARVALTLTVMGCGARVQLTDDETDSESAASFGASSPSTASGGEGGVGGAPQPSTTTGEGGETPVAVCSPAAPGEVVEVEAATFGCCVAFLEGVGESDWASPSEQHLGCCHEVVGQIDLDPALAASIEPSLVAPVFPSTGGTSCCDILGNPCTLPCGCTVWGPPVPRALAGRRLWSLDELEVA